ncbi:MAG: thermonuclease family protein [Advenella sp.]
MTSEVLRCLIAIIVIIPVQPVFAATWLEGWVVGIADGDTLTILDKARRRHKIRLAQIDAPESGMPYGRAAKKFLSDAVYRRTVMVQAGEYDRYGRVVGTVYLNQKNINMQMVASGYAWAYRNYVTDIAYCKAEDRARRQRRGLWAEKKPVPPWQWRRLKQR